MALEPDNTFQQIVGSIGYQILPTLRASADVAFGRGTQNADYLASTVNVVLAPAVPPLPAQSLDGKVDTYNGNVKLTYHAAGEPAHQRRLRIGTCATTTRPCRVTRSSRPRCSSTRRRAATPPFNLTQNLFKLNADYRGPAPGG